LGVATLKRLRNDGIRYGGRRLLRVRKTRF